jgi:hypothetical protein
VVTVTSTVPAEPGGEVAVIWVAPLITQDVDGQVTELVPKLTEVALPRLVPVMITEVPPSSGPEIGEMLVTVGAAVYV